jgi:hypothetical protein
MNDLRKYLFRLAIGITYGLIAWAVFYVVLVWTGHRVADHLSNVGKQVPAKHP